MLEKKTEEKLKQSESEFNDWMDSIQFVDEMGNVLPVILTEDTTDDPQGDRE